MSAAGPMSALTSQPCRIGFLNPWREGAEIQAFMSLAMAAQRIGCELIRVHNSQEIIAAAPDFVLADRAGPAENHRCADLWRGPLAAQHPDGKAEAIWRTYPTCRAS